MGIHHGFEPPDGLTTLGRRLNSYSPTGGKSPQTRMRSKPTPPNANKVRISELTSRNTSALQVRQNMLHVIGTTHIQTNTEGTMIAAYN